MQSQSIYKKLIQIIPDIATREEAGKSKLSSDALMDLNLDVLSKQKNIIRIALSPSCPAEMNPDLWVRCC